jgi:hypothetical protein
MATISKGNPNTKGSNDCAEESFDPFVFGFPLEMVAIV